MRILPRFTIARPRWLLIVGPDLNNSDWGVTLHREPIPPMGDWRRWRINWRINIRWPVQVSRKVRGKRSRMRHYCVLPTPDADIAKRFWTQRSALRWRRQLGEQAQAFKWDGEIWARIR